MTPHEEAQANHLIEVFADLLGAYGLAACMNALAFVLVNKVPPPVFVHRSTGSDGRERDMQRWLDTPPGPL